MGPRYFFPARGSSLSVGFVSSTNGGSSWSATTVLASGMPTTWVASTSQGRMVGDYISTSFGSDNLAHGVFATATAPTSGTSCGSTDNCDEPMDTFVSGLLGGSRSGAADKVLFSGNGGADAASLWNIVNNEGIRHRD